MGAHPRDGRQHRGRSSASGPEAVNVKAKTAEKLGAIGARRGIAAEAVALVTWRPPPTTPGSD